MARQSSTDTDTPPELEDLAKQIETLRGDLAELTETIGALGTAKGQQFARAARARGRAGAAAIDEMAHDAYNSADEFLRTQPATSLGLAAGLGFLVGMLLARR